MTFVAATFRITAGGIAWVLHFAAIYGITALACARAMPALVQPAIAFATLIAGAACVVIAWRAWREREAFIGWLSGAMAAMALFAIVLQALPAWQVSPCG